MLPVRNQANSAISNKLSRHVHSCACVTVTLAKQNKTKINQQQQKILCNLLLQLKGKKRTPRDARQSVQYGR
jgi:hypothetical protein